MSAQMITESKEKDETLQNQKDSSVSFMYKTQLKPKPEMGNSNCMKLTKKKILVWKGEYENGPGAKIKNISINSDAYHIVLTVIVEVPDFNKYVKLCHDNFITFDGIGGWDNTKHDHKMFRLTHGYNNENGKVTSKQGILDDLSLLSKNIEKIDDLIIQDIMETLEISGINLDQLPKKTCSM